MDKDKETKAIQTLKIFNKSAEPYYLCYSGGKDSDAIRILADLAGVNYELHHNHTTVDAPATVYYVRDVMSQYGEKSIGVDEDGRRVYRYGDRGFIHMPAETMWELIARKGMPPTRGARYCCADLKEKGGFGRRKVTGVRWDESWKRKESHGLVTIIGKTKSVQKAADYIGVDYDLGRGGGLVLNMDDGKSRRLVENCYRTTSTLINPIIDWTTDDVWEFLHHYGCEGNPLYKTGETRVGCVGCPLAGREQQKIDFERYPAYRRAYIKAFDKMLEAHGGAIVIDGKKQYWKSGEAVMNWWIGEGIIHMTLEEYAKFQEYLQTTMEEYM